MVKRLALIKHWPARGNYRSRMRRRDLCFAEGSFGRPIPTTDPQPNYLVNDLPDQEDSAAKSACPLA